MGWLRLILQDFAEEASRVVEEQNLQPVSYWIPGKPATFATSGEKPWKETLAKHVPPSQDTRFYGMDMQFFLPTLAPRGHPVDIDNLCEPVFSVIVNRLRWFNSKRSNIIWWSASKTQSIDSGLNLSLYPTPVNDINLGEVKLTPIFNHIYTGRYPESATDPVFAQWVYERMLGKQGLATYAVVMRFGDRHLNLGDVSTGKIKHIIDGLYPLLGGMPGRPDDWRISALAVEKGTNNLSPQSISIAVWEAIPLNM